MTVHDDKEFDICYNLTKVISEKYAYLISIVEEMNQIKCDFNETLLKLKEEKSQKCIQLSTMIERLKHIQQKLDPNGEQIAEIKRINEISTEFDGSSFKVNLQLI